MNRFLIPFICCLASASIHSEIVELINGDRYSGKVLSVDSTHVVVQSEIQGEIKLPRNKVAAILFRSPSTNPPSRPGSATSENTRQQSNPPNDVVAQLRQQGIDPQTLQQVQQQILGTASPEATQMFNDMMSGLVSGRLELGDIRKQAQSTLDEARALQKELGDDVGFALDGYLSILERFLNETAPNSAPPPTQPAPAQNPQP